MMTEPTANTTSTYLETVSRWFTPAEIIRFAGVAIIALAVYYATTQTVQSNVQYRLQNLEQKAQKLEDTVVRDKDMQQVVKRLDEIQQDIRELRAEINRGR